MLCGAAWSLSPSRRHGRERQSEVFEALPGLGRDGEAQLERPEGEGGVRAGDRREADV